MKKKTFLQVYLKEVRGRGHIQYLKSIKKYPYFIFGGIFIVFSLALSQISALIISSMIFLNPNYKPRESDEKMFATFWGRFKFLMLIRIWILQDSITLLPLYLLQTIILVPLIILSTLNALVLASNKPIFKSKYK